MFLVCHCVKNHLESQKSSKKWRKCLQNSLSSLMEAIRKIHDILWFSENFENLPGILELVRCPRLISCVKTLFMDSKQRFCKTHSRENSSKWSYDTLCGPCVSGNPWNFLLSKGSQGENLMIFPKFSKICQEFWGSYDVPDRFPV